MELKEYFASSRPTAVNLFWALNRMEDALKANKEKCIDEIKEALFKEAEDIRNEDVEISRGIGALGFKLLKKLKRNGE